jgi:cellulose synthase/poly-beta-1,6-N-acetylglucosamine synthase-like glycosyltransferase
VYLASLDSDDDDNDDNDDDDDEEEDEEVFPGLHLFLVVKLDNRKKHNSHEWFLKSFCDDVGATFALCTDCGTYFDKACLKELVKYLEVDDNCAAVCGRQRIMPMSIQNKGCPIRDSTLPTYRPRGMLCALWESWLWCVQCYDFESSHAVDKPAFSALGFMPVLPGPCGLFRYNEIRGRALDEYFAFVNKDMEDMDMVEANLTIAEDRILSLEACIHNNTGNKKTRWAPNALFYFEAELKLESFVKQRRRWNNGTVAGYFFLVRGFWEKIWLNGEGTHRWGYLPWPCWQIAVTVLVLCELVKYFIVVFTPSIFIVSLHLAIGHPNMFGDSDDGDSGSALSGTTGFGSTAQVFITSLYSVTYAYFSMCHSKYLHQEHDNSFRMWTFVLGITWNAIIMVFCFVGILLGVHDQIHHNPCSRNVTAPSPGPAYTCGQGITGLSWANSTHPNSTHPCPSFSDVCGMAIIPNTITAIPDGAFHNCRDLRAIAIPASVHTIGKYALAGSGLTSAELTYANITIDEGAFSSCLDLRSVRFFPTSNPVGRHSPHSVTLNADSFEDCPHLTLVCGLSGRGNETFVIHSTAFGGTTPASTARIKCAPNASLPTLSSISAPPVPSPRVPSDFASPKIASTTTEADILAVVTGSEHGGERVLSLTLALSPSSPSTLPSPPPTLYLTPTHTTQPRSPHPQLSTLLLRRRLRGTDPPMTVPTTRPSCTPPQVPCGPLGSCCVGTCEGEGWGKCVATPSPTASPTAPPLPPPRSHNASAPRSHRSRSCESLGFDITDTSVLLVLLPLCFVVFPILITILSAITASIQRTSLREFSGVGLMIYAFIPYYLFLPTLIAWYGAYAIARSSDLKWGNRPDSTESSAEVVETAQTLVYLAVTLNLVIAIVCIYNQQNRLFIFYSMVVVLFCSAFEMMISLVSFLLDLILLPCRHAAKPVASRMAEVVGQWSQRLSVRLSGVGSFYRPSQASTGASSTVPGTFFRPSQASAPRPSFTSSSIRQTFSSWKTEEAETCSECESDRESLYYRARDSTGTRETEDSLDTETESEGGYMSASGEEISSRSAKPNDHFVEREFDWRSHQLGDRGDDDIETAIEGSGVF